ncbi:NADH-quinone oxidoreductase subunit A [Zavarzinella formosa]|uniref:NADH-quinone oxidoreductase subunit A n=1 Tax=Zavarzinella formosa TaxID=360055 RepID=UPI00030F4A35|nr:NADH-quinone oxidoreductase subunit A [Zavarzinella formosa]
MTELVILILVFLGTGIGFLLVNLTLGKILRPNKPDAAKGTVYECGEPTIGSSWIQFDLRFYVVALLFVVFDVEMAFFFPWATVFGTSNHLADASTPVEARPALLAELTGKPPTPGEATPVPTPEELEAWKGLARLAFLDLLVFFGVMLVGFAYLWKRGDLEWIRSTAGQETTDTPTSSGGL